MLIAVVTLAACAGAERALLEQFFGASRLRDTTALQAVSTITFEPREQGIVRTFEITGVTPERLEGTDARKDVTVEAPVILPDGQTVREDARGDDAARDRRSATPWIACTGVTASGTLQRLDRLRGRNHPGALLFRHANPDLARIVCRLAGPRIGSS